MSGFKDMVKDGWHPKGKDGTSKESWRGDFKGINQVAGWMGKGKDGSADKPQHASRPISSLKDPTSFGLPPRRVDTGSAPYVGTRQQEESRSPPPIPSRTATTGNFSTDTPPPPPPARRSIDPSMSNYNSYEESSRQTTKAKPSLPPRLPPREESPPPPAYQEITGDSTSQLNQGAISRLGNAGVAVPALGIHNSTGGTPQTSTDNKHGLSSQNQVRGAVSSMSGSDHPNPPSQQYQQQPYMQRQSSNSSVTASANAFRERHSDHIQTGKKKLNALNQKYGITKRINSFIDDQKSPANSSSRPQSQPQPQPQYQYHAQPEPLHQPRPQYQPPATYPPPPNHHSLGSANTPRPGADPLNKRKPPPPPPKKPSMQSAAVGSQPPAPPPLPLNTKPRGRPNDSTNPQIGAVAIAHDNGSGGGDGGGGFC